MIRNATYQKALEAKGKLGGGTNIGNETQELKKIVARFESNLKRNIENYIRDNHNNTYITRNGYMFKYQKFSILNKHFDVEVYFNHNGWGDFGTAHRSDELVGKFQVPIRKIVEINK